MKFKTILRYFLIWQVLIIFTVTWSKSIFPLQNTYIGGGEKTSFSDPKLYLNNPELYFRGNFDGLHYVNLVNQGPGLNNEAFFPLYPKLIGFLNPLIRNIVVSGSLISSIFFLFGLYFFVKLIQLDHNKKTVFWSVIILFAFPVSFFFTSVYTEGLFFFLSVSCFYFARTRRWWLAACLVALATYTRFVGVFLIPALAVELYNQKPGFLFRSILPFLLMPLGLLIYSNYLWKVKGDPLAFIHVQKSFGQGRSDKIVLPYQVIYRYVRMLTTVSPKNPLYPTLALESFTAISFIALALIMVFKSRPSYALYALTSLILPTLTGNFTSMPRYALLCFPVFIFLGQYLTDHRKLRYLYLSFSLILAIIFLSLFARGYWVA